MCVSRVSQEPNTNIEWNARSLHHPQYWSTEPVQWLPEHLLKEAGSRSLSSSSKTNTLLSLQSPKMSCHGVQTFLVFSLFLCTMPVHLVRSTSLTLPVQGVCASTVWIWTTLWVSVTGLWCGHDVNLKGQLKISRAWQVLGGLPAIMLLANNFLHLNRNSVHRRWAPPPLSPLFACFSVAHQDSLSLMFICCPFS